MNASGAVEGEEVRDGRDCRKATGRVCKCKPKIHTVMPKVVDVNGAASGY